MTKNQLIEAMEICDLGLPSSGETEITDISEYVAYFCLNKLENKFFVNDGYTLPCQFDMDNEIVKFYRARKNGDTVEYLVDPETGNKKFDAYDFSNIVVIAPLL